MNAKLVTRRAALAIASVLALAAPISVRAEAASLAGHWQTNLGSATVDLIIQANGEYGSSARMNGMMTMQTGHVAVVAGILRFTVEDYAPRTQTMVGANNTHYETQLARPPNSSYRVVSLTATQLVLDDLDGGGQLTFRRVG